MFVLRRITLGVENPELAEKVVTQSLIATHRRGPHDRIPPARKMALQLRPPEDTTG